MADTLDTSPPQAADHHQFANFRCASFKRIIERNQSFDSDKTARELGRILEEIDAGKHLRFEIVRGVWPDANDTKYLYKLVIHPDTPPPAGLQKRPKVYWKVGRSIARCLDLPEETFTLRLFEGTSIARLAAHELEKRDSFDILESFGELAASISMMSAAVSRQHALVPLFRAMSTTEGRFNIMDQEIRTAGQQLLLAHGPLEDNFAVVDEWPPIPSIALYRDRRCPDFESSLLVAPAPVPAERATLDAWADASKLQKTTRWKSVPVSVSCWREVRLAIGPADASLQPRALFELRTVFDLKSRKPDVAFELLTPWCYDMPDQAVVVRQGQRRYLARVNLRPNAGDQDDQHGAPVIPLDWPIRTQGGSETIQPEHPYATWRAVTPQLCQELLENDPRSLTGNVLASLAVPAAPTLVPKGTVAAFIEERLLSGAIEKALEAEVIRMKKLVNSYTDTQRATAFTRHQAARQRWQRQ